MRFEFAPHGELELLAVMGDDTTVADCARVSVRESSKRTPLEPFIRSLMRRHHTSPFEMPVMRFRVKAPIFCFRQWHRHRTASINEISARYSKLPEEFWVPDGEGDGWRGQHASQMQCSDGEADYRQEAEWMRREALYVDEELIQGTRRLDSDEPARTAEEVAIKEYQRRLAAGVAREQARSCLPLSMYSEMVWQMNLHNLLHFLQLRWDKHAQPEIAEYAEAIGQCVNAHFPITFQAFLDYRKNAMTLSAMEIQLIKGEVVGGMSKTEIEDAAEKLAVLGYRVHHVNENDPHLIATLQRS